MPLDVVAALLRRVTAKSYIENYEANIRPSSRKAPAKTGTKPAKQAKRQP